MKAEEIRGLSEQELNVKLKDLKTELFNLRFQNATGQLNDVMTINKVKKDIARVKTIIREREIMAAAE
ncbi:MAG: 50S ribosomal protein L29 [Eubacteriales bacterium]